VENLFSNGGAFEIGGHLLDVSLLAGAIIELILVLGLALWLWPRTEAAAVESKSPATR
jgi:hypothetical protein